MIDETFLRQSVADLKKGDVIYIYNDKFIDIIANRYFQKYKGKLYLEKFKDYFALTTKARGGNKIELFKK